MDRVVDYASPPDQHPDARLLREYGTQEVMSTRTDVQSLYSHHIHGENQVIGLTDTGIDVHSCYFFDPDHPIRFRNDQPDTLHRKIQLYLPYANDREDMVTPTARTSPARSPERQSTAVATSSNTTSSSTQPKTQGIAYKARLVFEDIGVGAGASARLQTPRRVSNLIETVYFGGAASTVPAGEPTPPHTPPTPPPSTASCRLPTVVSR